MDDLLTLAEVGESLNRSVWTVRSYIRFEGLVHEVVGGKSFVRRSSLDEWRGREEIAEMLTTGDRLKRPRRRLAARTV